jgi:RNA-directed DNA polymerase
MEIAQVLNPMIQEWLNYFGKFRKSAMRGVFYCLNERLVHWVHNKYRSINWLQSFEWIRRQIKITPTIFAHWKEGFIGV